MTMQTHPIPTGYLIVDDYDKGKLETLSIGDYGKARNVKADFLGYTQEINGVPNGPCMPLSEKWVMTLSTQYGCPMKCTFCDVPKVGMKGNASKSDLYFQLENARRLFPSVSYTERLNIHFARMGEPILNPAVFDFAAWLSTAKWQIQEELELRTEVIHPVLTTSLPRNFKDLEKRLFEWCQIKNNLFEGQAGLQFSINSTNEAQRTAMFGDMQMHLTDFARMAKMLPKPKGRKYCLNFAYSSDFIIDAKLLAGLFSPDKFMVKITPIHNNNACRENGIETVGGYEDFTAYRRPEQALIRAGFDVLVFIPSMDEEDGLVTCGNAVLGGSEMKVDNTVINIQGIA